MSGLQIEKEKEYIHVIKYALVRTGGGVGVFSQSSCTSEENPRLSISCGCFFGGMGGGVPGVSMASLSLRSDE